MDNKKTDKKQETQTVTNNDLSKITHYEFEKNYFIVEPVFKENATDTLGTVLMRLINDSN